MILGSLAFYLVQFMGLETGQASYLLSSPWTQQSEEGFEMLQALLIGGSLPVLTSYRLSLAREGWRKLGHPHA